MLINPPKIFLCSLAVILFGYALASRGFAYIGIYPFYIGEAVLFIGLWALILVPGYLSIAFRSLLSRILLLFMAWGAFRTVPYIETYGFDALRDGVLWGYGSFTFLTAAFLARTNRLLAVPDLYGRIFIPWFLAVVPFLVLFIWLGTGFSGSLLPKWPGTNVSVIFLRSGHVGVHLAGIASFILLGIHKQQIKPRESSFWLPSKIWWIFWFAGFMAVASRSRGALLTIVMAVGVTYLLTQQKFRRLSLLLIACLVLLLSNFWSLEIRTEYRNISAEQIAANVVSIFGDAPSRSSLARNRNIRLNWWNDIIDYTVFGEYFWLGKGYGINLSEADGYQVGVSPPVRAPHNDHVTVLARSGVPGLVLWILLQGAFALSLIVAHFRAKHLGMTRWANINAWILCYWVAFMVNISFDPYLEGPSGGIWFWSLFGFGIAVLQAQRQHLSDLE